MSFSASANSDRSYSISLRTFFVLVPRPFADELGVLSQIAELGELECEGVLKMVVCDRDGDIRSENFGSDNDDNAWGIEEVIMLPEGRLG